MIHRLSKTSRQLFAVSLAIAAIALVATLVVGPVWSRVATLQEQIAQERLLLGRLKTVKGDNADLEAQKTKALTLRGTAEVISGNSESIRQAALQSQLADILSANTLKPRSSHALPAREHQSLHLIGAQLQIVAPIEKLQKVLVAIEDHKPALFIDTLQIVPSSASGLPNEDAAGLLDARLDIFAIAMPPRS